MLEISAARNMIRRTTACADISEIWDVMVLRVSRCMCRSLFANDYFNWTRSRLAVFSLRLSGPQLRLVHLHPRQVNNQSTKQTDTCLPASVSRVTLVTTATAVNSTISSTTIPTEVYFWKPAENWSYEKIYADTDLRTFGHFRGSR